jgi:hypothetical protein
MLKRLKIENFKSWEEAKLDFAPLTALFGANSSGKSSLIQFLLLLKQTKDSADRSLTLDFGGQESPVDLGSFREAVHKNDESASLKWTVSWEMTDELRISDPTSKRTDVLFRGTDISLSSSASWRGKNLASDFLRYHFGGTSFSLDREEDRPNFQLHTDSDAFRFVRTIGRAWDLPGPTKSYAFPDQARTYFQNSQFLSEFETAYVRQMDGLLHLGPLRDYPKRQYVWAGSSPVDVGRRGERTIDAILAATARGEMRNARRKSKLRPFQEMIALSLQNMELIRAFEVKEVAKGSGLYRAWVRRDLTSPETLITDVGFGISQVLPAVVLLYYAPEGSTIILEQPEIHLHPSVQAGLADLIVTAIKTRGLQVLMESHSEHLLQRLLRRIGEHDQSPIPMIEASDVKLYFCTQAHGVSQLEPLRLNLYGGIENWPKDFFGDVTEDAAAREEAALVRKMNQ